MYWFLYDRDLRHESVKIELKAQFINELHTTAIRIV